MKFISLIFLVIIVSCGKKSGDQGDPFQEAGDQTQSATADPLPESESTGPLSPVADPLPSTETPAVTATNEFELDARSATDFVYFKLENGSLIKSSSDQSWQVAVKRTQFQTNSGSSGIQNFGVFNSNTSDYASFTQCSAGPLTFDELLPASGAPGSLPYSGNAILNSWYDYDASTHVVSSKKHVYLISDGTSCFKFQIISYASGLYKVVADPMAIPEPPAAIDPSQTLDASSGAASLYLKFDQGRLVTSSADATWQMAVKRTQFQTNSGTSGTLQFGVAALDSTDYAQVTSCTATTFTYDEMLPASGAPGSLPYSGSSVLNAWYNYDPATHVVSSKKLVYLISDGTTCYKMQILSYSAGVYKVQTDSVPVPPPPAPVIHEQTIDASSTLDSVYLTLDQGQLVTTTSDQPWLFAVKRTQFQTNSGTSGTLGVGVYNSASTDFAAISSCANLTYTYDEMLPASGAPGSQPYSGNAVLNVWYDYDFITHTVVSKQHVYAIGDGTTCVKIQIQSYQSGIYSVKVSQL
ncbi:MAG TPA: HmuY family protein [Oligoflexus sp.]|uniref:HmuY family protein n=1 Tax=Oligoflexus sp. TaxID=1971216 RepID=UPI002D726076|nr:HmuY family protein [Oligoflexus sp.]HYX35479.1 HmuY family protein [Oligoflexus sp.]